MMRMLILAGTCALMGCQGLGGARDTPPRFDRPANVEPYDAYCVRVRNNLNEVVMQAGRGGFRLTALSDQGIACFERPAR